jgi:hypothetical protein
MNTIEMRRMKHLCILPKTSHIPERMSFLPFWRLSRKVKENNKLCVLCDSNERKRVGGDNN